VLSENPNDDERSAPNGDNETKHHPTETKPEISPVVGSAKPIKPPPNNNRSQAYGEQKHWLDYLEVGMAGLGLVILIAYTVFTARMYFANRDAADAAKEAANEAKLSRLQGEISFNATVQQFHLDQRAWVSIRSARLTTPYTPTQKGEITVDLGNTGKTPAINLYAGSSGFNVSPNMPLHPTKPIIHTVIAPGTPGDQIYFGLPPNPETLKLYIRFTLYYWDVFQKPSDQPHSTTFCGYYPSGRQNFLANCAEGAAMD